VLPLSDNLRFLSASLGVMVMNLSSDSESDSLVGTLVADKYRILRKLGQGGMGSVYLAEHVVIEKRIALKVLAPQLALRDELVARFLLEARSASRVGHENIIDISDFGQSSDGLVYIAMELLDGRNLGDVVRGQPAMAWKDARDIILQICRGLAAAHDKGIVHRDMKPENIFLVEHLGQPGFVKILDFGIAKVIGAANVPRLTRTGMIIGTPEYMSPEQAQGQDCDHRADIYAVGCIMYHLITGQPPFVAESFMAVLTKHIMETPVPPSVRRADPVVTPEMDALVLKALEKNRDQRWQTMGELLEAVTRCPESPAQGTAWADSETARPTPGTSGRGNAGETRALPASSTDDRNSENDGSGAASRAAHPKPEASRRLVETDTPDHRSGWSRVGVPWSKLALLTTIVVGMLAAVLVFLESRRTPPAYPSEPQASPQTAPEPVPPRPSPPAAKPAELAEVVADELSGKPASTSNPKRMKSPAVVKATPGPKAASSPEKNEPGRPDRSEPSTRFPPPSSVSRKWTP
jgi:serine/threonine protein kinase